MDQQSEYRTIYIQETEELLQKMNIHLRTLKKNAGNKEALEILYRCVHTMRGLSANMGYTQIAELSRNMEHVLEGPFSSHTVITTGAIDCIGNGLKSLHSMISLLKKR